MLELVYVQALREGGQCFWREFLERGRGEVRNDVFSNEICTQTIGKHRFQGQLFQQPRPHLLPSKQLLESLLQFPPKCLVLHLKPEILSHSQQLRQGELRQQFLHLILYLLVKILRQLLDLFQIGQDTGQLLAIRLPHLIPYPVQHLLYPRLLPPLQVRKNQEQLDVLLRCQIPLREDLLREVADILPSSKLPSHEDYIHQAPHLLLTLHGVFETLELDLLPKLPLGDAEPHGEDGILLQRGQRVHQIDRPYHACLELLHLGVARKVDGGALCYSVECGNEGLDLLRSYGRLRPV